ncbi:hypothetical protein SAMN02910278_00586 [Peptostreptococcus sp. D1]|nr:hypothetical protein SAMN02910278_00586 [Peptostreptococcus sp. D1]
MCLIISITEILGINDNNLEILSNKKVKIKCLWKSTKYKKAASITLILLWMLPHNFIDLNYHQRYLTQSLFKLIVESANIARFF